MVKINNLIISKTIGIGAISAMMAIGFYVLILDLPKVDKTTSNVSVVTSTEKNSESEQSELNDKNELESEDALSNTEGQTTPNTSTPAPASGTTNAPTAPPSTPTNPAPTYKYKDNSYTLSKNYTVPGNKTNTLTATISILNDTIISVLTSSVNDSKSQEYNDDFKANIGGVVEGKTLIGLLIPDGPGDAVGGASLTSTAFNDILNQVRATALK